MPAIDPSRMFARAIRRVRGHPFRLGVIAGMLLVVPVWAATGLSSSGTTEHVDTQVLRWSTTGATTSDTSWTHVPGFEDLLVVGRDGMSASFSGVFSSGPVDVRVLDGTRVMKPGSASFDPTATSNSFSFVFGGPGSNEAECHHIHVEWRATTGTASLDRALLVVTFNLDATRDGHHLFCA